MGKTLTLKKTRESVEALTGCILAGGNGLVVQPSLNHASRFPQRPHLQHSKYIEMPVVDLSVRI